MVELDAYFKAQEKVYSYFGYQENWRAIPLNDARAMFWCLEGEGPGLVCYADSKEELATQSGEYYEASIYTQRHLPKWVYRGKDYTMVVADTHCDLNIFLMIFSNSKEIKNGQ